MVIVRLSQAAFIFVFLLLNSLCFAESQPQLILFTDKTESILGRPIRAALYGISIKTKITDIKLNSLNKDFGVVTDYVINSTKDKRWPNQKIQILKFKLYPRKTGKLNIPSLFANKIKSKKKSINVIQGETGLPEITLSTNQPYEQQQIIINISITVPDSSARLFIRANQPINGFESTPLSFKRIAQKNGKYLLKTGWSITALKSGQLKLNLPPVEYSVSGVSRKQFYFPVKNINIKALPSYLPPTIPVGKITIQDQLSHNKLLQSDSLYYWNLKLNGNLNNTYRLPPVLRQIKSNKNIKFFPINSQRSINSTDSSLTSSVNHSIPFKALTSGFIKLPGIKIQYFDPDNKKIKIIIHPAKEFFVLSVFWQSILGIFIASFSVYLLQLIYKKWQKFKYSKLKRKLAIQLLQEDNSIEGVRESIRLLSEAEDWSKNITISQWARCWESKYRVNNNFKDLINMLSCCFYRTKTNCKTNEVSSHLLILINNRKKL